MSNIDVDIEAIVKNIGKDISFLQPVYEAIVNSLEANATEIFVEFFQDDQFTIEGLEPKVNSFVITDNGDGFTQENIESFKKLWTTHKIAMGCKGSGRFTWLNVFKKITIESKLAETNEVVTIPFSLKYGNNDIKKYKSDYNITHTTTSIAFEDVIERIFNNVTDKKHRVDKRESAN